MQSTITRGKNRNQTVEQYYEYTHEHEFDTAVGTEGINRTTSLTFESFNYTGYNLPVDGTSNKKPQRSVLVILLIVPALKRIKMSEIFGIKKSPEPPVENIPSA